MKFVNLLLKNSKKCFITLVKINIVDNIPAVIIAQQFNVMAL